jgi:hypothetical protein
MFKLILAITIGLTLTGCAYTPAPLKPGEYAWDGLGQNPNYRRAMARSGGHTASVEADQNTERAKVLATLRPYSAEWWLVHDQIEADRDRRTNAKLVICQGCLTQAPEATGSIR